MIDSHAHLTREFLKQEDFQLIIDKMKAAGVSKVVNVGTTVNDSLEGKLLAEKYPKFIYFTAGIHPHETRELDRFSELSHSLEGVVGIGECGLDYYWTEFHKEDTKLKQKKMFNYHLELAISKDLPVIIHCRGENAPKEMIDQVKDSGVSKGIWHSVAAIKKEVKKMLDAGFYMSFNGIITFKKAEDIRELAKYIPLDRIVLETDCPFLTPDPFRGKVNDPSYLPLIAQTMASIKNITTQEICEATNENIKSVLNM